MNAPKILFTTDFSSLSDAALPWATSLARDRGAELVVLHVQEPLTAYGATEWYYGPQAPDLEALRKLLVRIQPTDAKVRCTHEFALGDPALQIVERARALGAELIVMSSHGRSGLARALMGSVAEKVVRKATCPVLVYKPRVAEPAAQPNRKPAEVST